MATLSVDEFVTLRPDMLNQLAPLSVDADWTCMISQMGEDEVMCMAGGSDGFVYEAHALHQWLRTGARVVIPGKLISWVRVKRIGSTRRLLTAMQCSIMPHVAFMLRLFDEIQRAVFAWARPRAEEGAHALRILLIGEHASSPPPVPLALPFDTFGVPLVAPLVIPPVFVALVPPPLSLVQAHYPPVAMAIQRGPTRGRHRFNVSATSAFSPHISRVERILLVTKKQRTC